MLDLSPTTTPKHEHHLQTGKWSVTAQKPLKGEFSPAKNPHGQNAETQILDAH